MKAAIPLFFFLCLTLASLSQRVVNSTGGVITSNDYMIEYSVGEIAISTINAASLTLTQGVLQPSIKLVNAECAFINDTFEFFPNPTKSQIHLVGRYDWITGYSLYAADGKLVDVKPFFNNSIDLSHFAAGVYFVRLLPGCDTHYKTLKIFKQ